MYIKAITYYKDKNYEKALFFFEMIWKNYGRQIGNYNGMYNPILFAKLLSYRIYLKVYSTVDKKLKNELIDEIVNNKGKISQILFESIIINNKDIFTVNEIKHLKMGFYFNFFKLKDKVKISDLKKKPKIMIYYLKKFDYLYIFNLTSSVKKIYIADSMDITAKLNKVISKMKKVKIKFSFLDKMDNNYLGLFYNIKIIPKKLNSMIARIIRKYIVIFIIIFFIYVIFLFSMIRYIVLLYRLQQLREDFLNIISHELKTPLATIKLYSDTIINSKNQSQISEFAEIISSKTTQISNLISNMLYFNKLSEIRGSHKMKELLKKSYSDINLYSLTKKICRDAGNCYQKSFNIECNNKNFILYCDNKLVNIIFSNLIDNSFKHNSNDNIIINLKIEENDDNYEIFYSDMSESIIPINKKNIFCKFKTGMKRSNSGSSLGLGLYIVKQLLNLLDGSITVLDGDNLVFKIIFRKEQINEK